MTTYTSIKINCVLYTLTKFSMYSISLIQIERTRGFYFRGKEAFTLSPPHPTHKYLHLNHIVLKIHLTVLKQFVSSIFKITVFNYFKNFAVSDVTIECNLRELGGRRILDVRELYFK